MVGVEIALHQRTLVGLDLHVLPAAHQQQQGYSGQEAS